VVADWEELMPKELLFEIGTEEIPALFIRQAIPEVKRIVEERFAQFRLGHSRIDTWGTPRRLGLRIDDVEEKQQDRIIQIPGPPLKVSYDDQGNPTKAAAAFANKQGVNVETLEVISREKGDYLCVRRVEEGEATISLLPGLLRDILLNIPFPKSMRWSDGEVRFARPIHWILALYGSEVIDFEFGGIKSGENTCGHRFVAPDLFPVDGYASYLDRLREASVIVDPDERRRMILNGVEKAADSVGGKWKTDNDLLEEVTFLTEYPIVLLGRFDEEYLALPPEVLVAAMREHQRYFSLEEPEATGRLMAYFIVVSNTPSADPEVVVRGNERVLRARLADARFFFEADRSVPLAEHIDDLKGVVFQQRLGTSSDKVMRFKEVADWLADRFAPESKTQIARAALLCKADLVTEMVGEFPSLQGLVGRIYARLDGEPEEVAEAIFSHYLPLGGGGELADSDTGAIVGIADKIDTLVSYFAIGEIPTGTADPFALRRRALGILRTILHKSYRVSMRDLIEKSMDALKGTIEVDRDDVGLRVLEFIRLRLQNLLLSEGYAYDIIDAVLAVQDDDLVDFVDRVRALAKAKELPEFRDAAVAFKRVGNIIGEHPGGKIAPDLLDDGAEIGLYQAFMNIKDEFEKVAGERLYNDVCNVLARLRPHIDLYFDEVMVMVDDDALRRNRISLLREVFGLFSRIADFSKIIIE